MRTATAGYRLRRIALGLGAAMALSAGLAAILTTQFGVPDPGVVLDGSGHTVEAVSPSGFAWQDGIRPGQVVVNLVPAFGEGGWALETTDGVHRITSSATAATRGLRERLPISLLAVIAGAAAILLLRTRRAWCGPMSAIGLVVASSALQGSPTPGLDRLVASVSSLVALGLLVDGLRMRPILGAAVAALGLVLLTAWWSVVTAAIPIQLESIRADGTVGAISVLALLRFADPIEDLKQAMRRPGLVEAVTAAGFLLTAAALAATGLLSPLLAIPVAATLATAVWRVLRPRRGILESALFGDERVRAAAEATERERERVAREIHDVPLQELVGILRRVEVIPGAAREVEDLRALAAHLRNVAMDLRPPVLDDLGLGPALEDLRDHLPQSTALVEVETSGDAGIAVDERPPALVELAAYRVTAEAVANAIRHSSATRIRVVARIDTDLVDLSIADDGVGVDEATLRRATRQGHLGMRSMRQRAVAVDADFSVRPGKPGTLIEFRWRAP